MHKDAQLLRGLTYGLASLLLFAPFGNLAGSDFSGAGGIAISAVGAASDEHGPGAGGEATINLMIYNASVEAIGYRDAYRHRNFTASGFIGIGWMNPLMLQVGAGTDGFAARLHGEIAIMELENLGIYKGKSPVEPVISYSFGYQESGIFGTLGAGLRF